MCQRMGWSWRELCETPRDVVEALVDLLTEQSREGAQQAVAQTVTRPRRRR